MFKILSIVAIVALVSITVTILQKEKTATEVGTTAIVEGDAQERLRGTDALPQNDLEEILPVVSTHMTLDLSGQGLTKTPAYVFDRTNIQELNLSNNNLKDALQAEVGQLQGLKILNVSNNQFTGLPAEIGQLQNLQILNLSNNRLTGLPHELGNLLNLKELNLKGNNISSYDLSVIKENLPTSTVIYMD